MFTLDDIKYRAGIKIIISSNTYAYSMEYFMRCFVEFSKKKAAKCPKIGRDYIMSFAPRGSKMLFQYSQSIIGGDKKLDSIDLEDIKSHHMFPVNVRGIKYPHDTNCYAIDDALITQHGKSISYLQMARHLQGKLNNFGVHAHAMGCRLATFIINYLLGGVFFDDKGFEIVSIIMAALFISEPKRNPACFIPSLMLLQLIQKQVPTPFGDLYQWNNSLQNTLLVFMGQSSPYISFLALAHSLFGEKDNLEQDLKNNTIKTLTDNKRSLVNAAKKYNKIKNQKKIKTSEFLMQLGGYFPMTHRFSYAELDAKRRERILTLSDIKSFILITDWLNFKGIANPIHKHHLKKYPKIDSQKAMLMEILFPTIWEKIDQFIYKEDKITFDGLPRFGSIPFEALLPLLCGYPALLTKFGCRQKKLTSKGAASIFRLLCSSKKHQDQYTATKLQFKFWCINHEREHVYEEVENIMKSP